MENIIYKTKVNKRAITYGVLLGVIGPLLVLTIVSAILGALVALKGEPREELVTIAESPLILILSYVLGVAFPVFGGFLSARIAKSSWLKHSLYVGIFTLVFFVLNILILNFVNADYPRPQGVVAYNIFNFISIIPLAVLGGYWASKLKNGQI